MKVYIVQDDGTKNFSELFKLTDDIVAVTKKDCPMFNNKDHIKNVKQKLKFFDVWNDMLVLVGCPVNIGVAVAEITMKGGGTVLKWDRQSKGYIPIKL